MKGEMSPLSSEQALDDYFTSLLSLEEPEDEQESESVTDSPSEVDSESSATDIGDREANLSEDETQADENGDDATPPEQLAAFDDALIQEPNQSPQDLHSDELSQDIEFGLDEFDAADDLITDTDFNNMPEADRYVTQPQLANTQPLAQAALAEMEQLPDLQNLEKLFSSLQAQVDSEVDTIEFHGAEPLATFDDAVVAELPQVEQEPETVEDEIQAWDVEFDKHLEQQAPVFDAPSANTANTEHDTKAENENADIDPEVASVSDVGAGSGGDKVWQNGERDQAFQVLYFDVNGVTFAVPLDELGGIHKLTALSHLIGRPSWYLGLQTSRENQLDVVDTAMWAMPDVLTDEEYKQAYEYVVMLGESQWGLASTELKGTEMLTSDKIRWRETAGKRPWLAGMVKEQMCALVHVSELIGMLNAGLDVKSVQ